MLMFNHSMPGMGQTPMPGMQYYNPYCQVQSVPCGNQNLSYNQRLYNNQQQFVNQMMMPPVMSYEAWKQQFGYVAHSAEQEDYYLNLYNTSVLPQQRAQMINQQRWNYFNNIHGQTQMPYMSPYAYQNVYIYGYDKTRDAFEYNRALCGAIPRMQEKFNETSQSEIMKQQEMRLKFQLFLRKKLTAIGMKHTGCKDEEITKRLESIDKQYKPNVLNQKPGYQSQPNTPKDPKEKPFKLRLLADGAPVKEFVVGSLKSPEKTIEEKRAINYAHNQLLAAREIQYTVTMNTAVREEFANNIEKFKDMPLIEFLNNHGGNMVAEALESKFINAFKNKVYSYNKSNYMNTVQNHSQYQQRSGVASSFYCTSLSQTGAKTIKDMAINPPQMPKANLQFVEYLNFLDTAQPVSNEEYQRYLQLLNGNEREAKGLTIYKACHPEFDVEAYVNSKGFDPNNRLDTVEYNRLLRFYDAMLERRPDLRNGKIGG